MACILQRDYDSEAVRERDAEDVVPYGFVPQVLL